MSEDRIAIRFFDQGEHVLSAYENEVSYDKDGKTHVEMKDVFERKFWDLSVDHLSLIKKDLTDSGLLNTNPLVRQKMLQIVNKVLKQREFMKDNLPLRQHLKPE